MVGRGLRTVNPEEYPGVVKTDCIVLDFGTSSLLHGSLEQDVDLDGHVAEGAAPTKTCPACGRAYDSRQIPADEYAQIRRLQLRYRALPIAFGVAVAALSISFGLPHGGTE